MHVRATVWQDPTFRALGDAGKLLLLRLLGGIDGQLIPGLFILTPAALKVLARELGRSPEEVGELWIDLQDSWAIHYSDDTRLAYLPLAGEYVLPEPGKVDWTKALRELPDCGLKFRACTALARDLKTVVPQLAIDCKLAALAIASGEEPPRPARNLKEKTKRLKKARRERERRAATASARAAAKAAAASAKSAAPPAEAQAQPAAPAPEVLPLVAPEPAVG